MEFQIETVKPYVDCVITFEELQALFDSADIDVSTLEENDLNTAAYYGRLFARCGGLSDAVAQALKEQGIDDFDLKAISCDGIEACKIALLKAQKRLSEHNFIEGMACQGGCVGGAGCLTHAEKNKLDVDKYSSSSNEKTITNAINKLKKQ